MLPAVRLPELQLPRLRSLRSAAPLRQFVARRRASHGVSLALLLTLAAGAPLGAQSSLAESTAALTLQPGDALKVTVWKVPELNGEFPVAPDGTLAHPAFPTLVVAGVPLSQLQVKLDSVVKLENTNARAVLQPMLHITVGGEVSSPNLYRHPAGTTIAQAIVLAGGANDQGNLHRVRLVRGGTETYLDLLETAGPATRMPVASGDALFIERRGRSFRESILPFISVLGTAASIANLIIRSRR